MGNLEISFKEGVHAAFKHLYTSRKLGTFTFLQSGIRSLKGLHEEAVFLERQLI